MNLTPKQFGIIATKQDLKELEERMDEKIEKKIDKVITAVDGLSKIVKDFQAELASNQSAQDRMQKHIESLDKRLTRVELRTGVRTHSAK